jgi:outer membrane protein assembly factor BamB
MSGHTHSIMMRYAQGTQLQRGHSQIKLWTHLTQMQIEYSSPAVVDGVVYFGSNDNRVRAVNASTGHEIWSFLTGNSVESSCTVVNGVVYFGSHDHNVYALDSATGTKIWNFTTKDEVYSTPAVVDGVVYVGSNDKTCTLWTR